MVGKRKYYLQLQRKLRDKYLKWHSMFRDLAQISLSERFFDVQTGQLSANIN